MRLRHLSIVGIALLTIACTESTEPSARPATPRATASSTTVFPPAITPYEVSIDPANFVEDIDNEFLPLFPGYTLIYEGTSDGEPERDVVTVTHDTKTIMGVECVVVRDVVFSNGEIAEKTFDWYAQDIEGNVWYFGEDSTEYENGKPAGTEGSWEGGVDGALPGIIMLADPQVGEEYRQEYAPGEAEDVGRVIDLDAPVSVPFAEVIEDALVTEDSSLIERGVVEHKYYSSEIGVVLERSVKGPKEVMKLVDARPRD